MTVELFLSALFLLELKGKETRSLVALLEV